MKELLFIFFFLHSAIGFSQSNQILKKFDPIKFKENLKLRGYDVRETYKISDQAFLLIASPKKIEPNDEGLRIILLTKEVRKFKIKNISNGVGESYIYRPSFYEGKGKIVIVCESGAEYSWGLDVFLLVENSLQKLGEMNVAARINKDEHQESAIPILRILEGKSLKFKFIGNNFRPGFRVNHISLFHKPGQTGEEVLPVDGIEYEWDGRNWEVNKKE